MFSPTSAWVFSLGVDSFSKPDHYVAEYNGTSWSKVTLPGVPSSVSVVAPDDVWALGTTPGTASSGNPGYIAMHWNGTSWSSTALPTVTPPKNTTEYPGDIVATGPADAWLPWNVLHGSAGAVTKYLLHWNGTSWVKVSLTLPTSFVNSMAQDGHGGLWLVDNGPAPGYTWYLDHLNAAGKWTRYDVPAATGTSLLELTGITWAPGSRSVWAQGDMVSGNDIYGAVLRYTP